MKFIRFHHAGTIHTGIVTPRGILPMEEVNARARHASAGRIAGASSNREPQRQLEDPGTGETIPF